MSQKNIIPIERASEKLIGALIKIGIIYIDETGMHVINSK